MNAISPATLSASLPFYWSVRRELWENRSIYIAPMVVAGLVLLGVLIGTGHILKALRGMDALTPAKQIVTAVTPYSLAASVILLASFIVGLFYCFGALNSERQDRSILFWKSMPVSDLLTVLSKASIPLVVLPAIAFTVALATQLVMLIVSTIVLLANGISPAKLWTPLPMFSITVVMAYGVVVHALWFAPIYAWVLLVSAWAKRAVFLWAVLPFVAFNVVEFIALGTSWFGTVMRYRVLGATAEAFTVGAGVGNGVFITQISQLDPVKFLSTPNLWLGLGFAVACLTFAVRLRRFREPN